MTPITINLADHGSRGPTSLCRDLIKDGADPEALVEFTRGNTPVFGPTPARWWAERRVREADHAGPMRFVKIADAAAPTANAAADA